MNGKRKALVTCFVCLVLTLAFACNSAADLGGTSTASTRSAASTSTASATGTSVATSSASASRASSSIAKASAGATAADAAGVDAVGNTGGTGAPGTAAPAAAITQGSFTVWAEPAVPLPHHAYQVYVQVALPAAAAGYTVADLSGHLVGTDGYTQGLGADAGWADQQTFATSGNTALLVATVLGAKGGVNDTITIHSALLNETQTISLTFTAPTPAP